MALYVDNAYLPDILEVMRIIPLAGVTTNPTIMLAARERGQNLTPLQLLMELLRRLDGRTVFIQPGEIEEEKMYRQAMQFIETDPTRVVPKIPMTQAGIRVARSLKRNWHRIAFTAVTSVSQAYIAAMVPADFIIPYYNRLQRSGVEADERIAQMAELFHNQQLPTRILAASIKTPVEAASALAAGAHDITAAPQVLLDMISDPQTEEAVEKFTQDWQTLNNPQ
jgi:TalC/MipB family fructose-6-phosphate aldolase